MPKGVGKPEKYEVDEHVHVEMHVTKEDMAAIQVSRIETELIALRNSTDKQIETTEREIDRLAKKLTADTEKRAKATWSAKMEPVRKALLTVGLKTEVSVAVSLHVITDKPHMSVYAYVWYGNSKIGPSVNMPLNKAERSLITVRKKEEAVLKSLRQKAVDVRRHLSQIPVYERQAHAATAKSVLEKTPAGRAMLASLPKVSPLGLPAPK